MDLTAVLAGSATAEILVRDLLVLRTTGGSTDIDGQSVIYLAMTESQARQVTGITPDTRIGIAVRPR
ncbi:MAG: hypothetical protein WCA46_10950 [Actinocatenispora sp.]